MDNDRNLPKEINTFDKIKLRFKRLLGYRDGEKFTLGTIPEIKDYSDIQLMKLANIEQKLKNVVSENNKKGYIENGIEENEARQLVEWTVQNARKFLINEGETVRDVSMFGRCGWAQAITATTLRNMGLSPYVVNANPTLSIICGRHAFVTVNIPIKEGNRKENKMYLVDPTFRQFFLRDDITNQYGAWINDKEFGGKVAPLPGYWILKMGKKGRAFADEILSKGFIEFTDDNAKMYGDSFVLESIDRKDHSKVPSKKEMRTGILGSQYIANIISPNTQEELDVVDGEFERTGTNIETPLMQKERNIEQIYVKQENNVQYKEQDREREE